MKKVIISVLGPDKPGIVAAISKNLFSLECNVENVSQTSLQSEFAGIFIISKPKRLTTDTVQSHLHETMAPLGLHVQVKDLEYKDVDAATPTEPFVITTRGPDRKGLVAKITAVIASYAVKGGENPKDNIMIYEVDVPIDVDQHALCGDLRNTADRLGLDISIQHRNIFEAINRI